MADGNPSLDAPEAYLNRELSWLAFASRVAALVEDRELPLIERLKFLGIVGMLHDEFFMKRMSGLKRQAEKKSSKLSMDGRTPGETFAACRKELLAQVERLSRVFREEIRPALAEAGLPILDHDAIDPKHKKALRSYFKESVQPILTPLAVDPAHPFPFISNLGLNLAVLLPRKRGEERFLRIKVPNNRPRWVPLPGRTGFVPLEQVIAANLDLVHPGTEERKVHLFRVTRGAEGDAEPPNGNGLSEPGSIIHQVSHELKARRFAGAVRLELDEKTPKKFTKWLAKQVGVGPDDLYSTEFFGLNDLARIELPDRPKLRFAVHRPVTHERLRALAANSPRAIFDEIDRGDILLHHPYHSFDSSVLRFIQSAAADPAVLAIKLTIYRTNPESPIVRALADASRRGKQVAVLVEVTARFDEAPNIAWGQYLEKEGVHVAYGVDSLKTHVKLALVVREEAGALRRYAHVGTGNYHTETARIYEDLGVLTSDSEICDDVATVFNTLTGATPHADYERMIVAPVSMRTRFNELIRREAEHAEAGRPSGISAKMNQLQDRGLIGELYQAGQAGVPIRLNVRGLCCLRPGVPGLSENIRVFSIVGRFLEHSRLYRFTNGGSPEYYLGSADWMRRNLNNRVETILPVVDPRLQGGLDAILDVYDRDNCSAWDCGPDGTYTRRRPAPGEKRRAAQEIFIDLASGRGEDGDAGEPESDLSATGS